MNQRNCASTVRAIQELAITHNPFIIMVSSTCTMKFRKKFNANIIIFILVLVMFTTISKTSASISGFAQFTEIRVKDFDTWGNSEFQLQFQCRDSDMSWGSVQTSNYDYDVNPSGYETYYGNTEEDAGGQTLWTASYEAFYTCYDLDILGNEVDIGIQLVERDIGVTTVVSWVYFDIAWVVGTIFEGESDTSSSMYFKFKVDW